MPTEDDTSKTLGSCRIACFWITIADQHKTCPREVRLSENDLVAVSAKGLQTDFAQFFS
jgi:hypothetical protein